MASSPATIGHVLRTDRAVTLAGGAPMGPGVLADALAAAPLALAADGGAAALMAVGIVPERVIGDLDSLPPDLARALEGRIQHVADQDTTDLQKCLARIDAPLVIGAGFLGGRTDHALAALAALADEGARPVILLGDEDAAMHLAAPTRAPLPAGARVSLMPLAPVRVASSGLRWPVDNLALSPLAPSASNMATGPVRLAPDGPGTILVTERRCLGALLAATGPGAPSRFLSASLP